MTNSPSLYIGRFQPFHLGHLDAIKQALKKEPRLLIGIGSAEDNFLIDNPFTAGERFQMIDESLQEAGISRESYSIIPIRNINNYAIWANHVEIYCPPFGNVYTGSDIVARLFEAQGVHKVIKPKFNNLISATSVREKMLSGKPWHDLLPHATTRLLIKIKAEQRLKEIHT